MRKNKDQTRHHFIDTHTQKKETYRHCQVSLKNSKTTLRSFEDYLGGTKYFSCNMLGSIPFLEERSFSVHNIQSFRLQRNHSTLQWKQWLVSAGASSGDSALANMYGSLKIYV